MPPVPRKNHRPRLGLVCQTTTEQVRFRTMTRARYLKLTAAQQRHLIAELYADNLRRLMLALDFCADRGIGMFRMPMAVFALCDEPVAADVLADMSDPMKRLGERARELNIRVVCHPEQFIVLSSLRPEVVQTSIQLLQREARVMDALGLERSSWAALIIHGGKSGRADALVDVLKQLPPEVKSRIVLENDERAYSAGEILDVCRRAGVPMVFDAHHHVVHEFIESYDEASVPEMVRAARETWPDPAWQIVHISNGLETFLDARHSRLITAMPAAYASVPWIEVEAKGKELAIEDLRQWWQPVKHG